MLKTSFGHCDGADHICTLELETRVTELGEQLQALGCSGKTLGTPEEVSRALRSQVLQLEGLAFLQPTHRAMSRAQEGWFPLISLNGNF